MIAHVALLRRLPRRLDVLSYSVPSHMNVKRGDLVLVPFRVGELRGVVTGVEDGSTEKLRPLSKLLEHNFLSNTQLTVLEETAREIVQSVSTLLHAAFPTKKSTRLAPVNYPVLSVRRDEISYVQEAVVAASKGSSFIQVVDLVQAAAIAHAVTKKEPSTCVLVPHHHDAQLVASHTRLGSLTIPPRTRQILVLHSGSSEHAQYDRNPRYDARDVAFRSAEHLSCPIAFLDVSPRAVDLVRCSTLLELPSSLRQEPVFVDLKHERGKGFFLLSETLMESINEALQNQKKVILSYNRKGLSRSLECRDCGWIAEQGQTPERCEMCHSTRLTHRGIGNQLLERELKKRFTPVPVLRIERGVKAEIPPGPVILIVTQFYFESVHDPLAVSNIGLVADVRADLGLMDPWYTSTEQTLSKLCALQGLAFRAKARYLLQAFDLPLIRRMVTGPVSFLRTELVTRRTFDYPPFHALYRVDGKLMSEKVVNLGELKQLDDKILIERNPEKSV